MPLSGNRQNFYLKSLGQRPPRTLFRGVSETHEQLVERFFNQPGVKHTAQREAIVRAFLGVTEHISIDDLLTRVREQHPGVGYATVYRTLRLLKQAGVADERHFGDGKALYEPAHEHHHDHLICTSCGTIVEFENDEIEALQEKVAARNGFRMLGHKMEIYGLCPNCVKEAP